jgi:hypothetical protein
MQKKHPEKEKQSEKRVILSSSSSSSEQLIRSESKSSYQASFQSLDQQQFSSLFQIEQY